MKTPRMTVFPISRLTTAALSFALTAAAAAAAPTGHIDHSPDRSPTRHAPAAPAATPLHDLTLPRVTAAMPRSAVVAALRAQLEAAAKPSADAPAAARSANRDDADATPTAAPQSSATAARAAKRGAVDGAPAFAAASATTVAVSPQDVVNALLRGEDARAAIASLRSAQPSPDLSKAQTDESASGGFVRAREALRGVLAGLHKRGVDNGTARSRLIAASDASQAQALLLDLRLEQQQAALRDKPLPATATAQVTARTQRLRDHLRAVAAAASTLRSTLNAQSDATPIDAAVTAELDALLATDADDAPVYGANPLPVHRPRLPAREPAMTPAIVPSYAIADADVEPQPADYADSADAALSPAILAHAASLGHDYTRIVDFVRSTVRTRWYAGARQDADATLRSLSGNDVDQASLLIALLRASRAPARYVHGVVEVNLDDLAASLGVRGDKVGLALAAAGIAQRPVVRGGRIAAYAIEHTFVSAHLPMSNYRGSSADRSGRSWIALAPALKPHRFVAASGAFARTQFDANTFIDGHLQQPRNESPLQRLRDQIASALGVQSPPLSYDAMLAQHAVDAPPLELLPASLPMPVLAVTGEFAQLPEQLRQQLHLVVRSGEASDAPIALETRIGVAQLAGRRISLAWQPASVDDGAIVDAHGGMSRTPPYLYRVRPMLLVAGQAERAGTAPIDTATRHRVELTFEGPGGSAGFAQTLIAGGQSALAIDVSDSAAVPDHASALPGDSEQRGARLLANLGARYLATWNGDDDELAALAGVGVVRPFPSAALVISQYRVDRLDGLATAMRWRGVALDAAMRPAEAFAAVATNAAESDWTALSALQGSALEHRVFEQQWSVASISADKGLALARSQGRTVLTLNATSGSGGVHQPPAVVAAIDHWLARGYVVEVPAEPLTQDAWTGAVWRVRSLSTGESGYFIAGQLAGGSTTLPPELWYLQDLVAVLGDPSALPPNENPLAAAILTLDRTTQHQSGTADQTLPEPLRALALDTDGRPVRNAVVTFRVTASDSQLLDAQGHEAASVSVTTDARGLAASPLKLARRQGTTGHYVLPDPDTQQLQWVGHATVEVSVTTATGELHSGEAFVADIGPATPQQLHVDYPDTQAARYFRIGYDSVRATVTDAFDNPVSNVPVIARVDTDFSQSECTGTTRFGPLIGAALFDKRGEGGCPTDDFRLTGHACTRTSPLPMTTGADGIVFFVTAPSHPRTQYTVHVSAVGHEENASLQTHPLNSATGCNSFISLFHQMDNPVNAAGQSAYAAKPGEIIAAPYTFQALVAMVNDLSNVDGPPWSWQPLSGGRIGIVDPLQHGSLDSWREVAPGQYAFYLRAGAVPGDIRGRLSLTGDLPPGAGSFGFTTYDLAARGVYSEDTDDYSYGWSIDLNPPRLEPDRIALTPFNTTQADLVLRSDYYPPQWQPSVNAVYLMRNGEDVEGCSFLDRNYDEACTIRRGLAIDPAAQYTATTVLHNGLVRLESEPTEVHFNAGIIAGYGLLPTDATQTPRPASNGSPKDETELIGLLRGKFPPNLSVSQDVDTATGYVCETPTRLGYLLSQPARVDIRFRLLDRDGNPTDRELWPQPEQQLDAGLHFLEIPAARLPIGSYVYELTAISAAGVQDQRNGLITSTRSRHDVVPLAHSFAQGIDLYSGGAVLQQPDIVLGGRGPGLSLVRTYSSHAGDRRGFFGRGWSADLDMQVTSNACGSHTVLGGAGQGMRFVPDGIDPDGALRYRPLYGYHGSLVRHGNLFDFIARNGTRYHFAEPDPDGPRLSYVEDTNGNRVTYTWQRDADTPRVEYISDAAGRTIALTYAIRTVSRPVGDIDILDSYTLVTSASVPEELRVDYRYDDTGNLVEARRSDRTNLGTQRTQYDYADYDGLYYVQPDGEMAYARFGFRLTAVRDAIDGSVRRYRYAADGETPTPYWTGVQTAERTYYYPELRVTEVTLPDTASTTFAYDEDVSGALRGLMNEPVTIVTDARNHPTTTRMNRYGAATTVIDPVGTTHTTWDTVHLQPATQTDALGGITTFTYDDHGNTTSEVLVTPHGERRQSWTYHPTSAFDTPHVTDRVATTTDPRSYVTRHEYDRRGNPTTTTRGGVTTTDGYAANGDRTSRIDGNGKTWLIRY
ncbi:DUF6531 domain-containing protein, partial [Tahibacter sp.]|uniref:DUF6531 domain-containing protein n=1 Tax=Tahibacter sp. TaxID=2056211 RepID=UPI0028C453D7